MSEVYIVHCIDTEGPLHESTQATFERLKYILKIDEFDFEENQENIDAILNGDLELKNEYGISALDIISPHLLKLNNDWSKIYEMYKRIEANKTRFRLRDVKQNGWRFTFHVLDHVEYKFNPRRRAIGYGAVYSEYKNIIEEFGEGVDTIEHHFHPMNSTYDAHRCATAYDFGETFNEVLCRRIIDFSYFPSSYRAGFQCERYESNLMLEQWFPFDISNMAEQDISYLTGQKDFANGRSGDWRGAPYDWTIYNPAWSDWRKPGTMKRSIARALNPLNRIGTLNQEEVDRAFETAANGKPAILGIASHDWRDLETEILHCQELIENSSRKYAKIKWEYKTTKDAFRSAKKLSRSTLDPVISFTNLNEDYPEIKVSVNSKDFFMMQPFFAIKTRSGKYFRDNMNGGISGEFFYAFYFDTIDLHNVESIGIALTSNDGTVYVYNIDVDIKSQSFSSPLLTKYE